MDVLDFAYLLEQILEASGKEASLIFVSLHVLLINMHFFIHRYIWRSSRFLDQFLVVACTLNCKSFSWTSLSVSENRPIITLEALIHNRLAHYLEDFFLSYLFTSNVIKGVGILTFVRGDEDLFPILNISNASSLMGGEVAVHERHHTHVLVPLIHHCHVRLVMIR